VDLRDVLRTTGAIREFTPQQVSDATLYEILDDARFAPSGGNRQAWRAIVVRGEQRARLRAIYLKGWREYLSYVLAGQVPFSPLASDVDRAAAAAHLGDADAMFDPSGFAETLDRVPVMLVVLADLGSLAATDRDLDRYHLVGGASIYPFVWSILLGAHERGLAGVMTTVLTRYETEAREVLQIPDDYAVAALVALGYPVKRLTKLTRRRVEEFTTWDTFDGAPFETPAPTPETSS
jgi:nitroreductase